MNGKASANRQSPRAQETVGQRIARFRKERGITQVQLAESVGLAQPNISDYERDIFRPSSDLIVKLTEALGVSADELLGLKWNMGDGPRPTSRKVIQRHDGNREAPRKRPGGSAARHRQAPDPVNRQDRVGGAVMPTVLRIEGFRFFFFSNENNEPPHIHVEKGDGYGKLWLHPTRLASSTGFTRAEMRRIRELTFEHQRTFVERWNEYFG